MEAVITILRIVHILGATIWAGNHLIFGLLANTFHSPDASAAHKLHHLGKYGRAAQLATRLGGLGFLAGVILYWRVSVGFDLQWMGSTSGLLLTLASFVALVGAVVSEMRVGRTYRQAAALEQEIKASGASLSTDQADTVEQWRQMVTSGDRLAAALLLLGALGMLVA